MALMDGINEHVINECHQWMALMDIINERHYWMASLMDGIDGHHCH
jgi:hypothetical protein